MIADPSEWTDEDILNAWYLQIYQYNDDKTINELWKKLEIIYKLQHTEVYKNSIRPIIKMIYSSCINSSAGIKSKVCK